MRRRRSALLFAGAATRLLLALLCSAAHLSAAVNTSAASVGEGPVDTWAVIVDSSRYWLNYRHAANALGIYQAVRRLGLPDSRILLMLADQPACSPRNVHPGRIYLAPGAGAAGAAAAASDPANLLPQDIELDYRGREVSAETVLRVLTGRHLPGTPASKRLRSGRRSRVLLYLTGHGGDEFLKFHDQEELLATDLAAALAQMHAAGRYGELLLLADTCQASSLYAHVTAPGVLALASSKLGQSSYAHHLDATIGLHVVDQASYHLHHFLTTRLPPDPAAADGVSAAASGGGSIRGSGSRTRGPSLQQLVDYLGGQRMSSEVQLRTDLFPRCLTDVAAAEFFGTTVDGRGLASGSSSGDDGGSEGTSAAARALMALAAAAHEQQTGNHGLPVSGAVLQGLPPQRRLFALLEHAGGRAARRRASLAGGAAASA